MKNAKDRESYCAVILALGYLGGELALQALTSLPHPGDYTSLLHTVVYALEQGRDPRVIPSLRSLLQEEEVRAEAVCALGRLHAVEAVEDILPLLQDSRETPVPVQLMPWAFWETRGPSILYSSSCLFSTLVSLPTYTGPSVPRDAYLPIALKP